MVDYHVMAEGHSIQLRVGGGCCEPHSRYRAAPWWRLEFFEKLFEYRPEKDVQKTKNRYILSLRME